MRIYRIIVNSNLEIRNKSEYQITKIQNKKEFILFFEFAGCGFFKSLEHLKIRVSYFVLRISDYSEEGAYVY